ncbi:MAG: YggS family pyridoxal phosphate-dependent enzyme [Acidimicrobiia bacterium]
MALGLDAVQDRIALACARRGVDSDTVTLVVVSKHRTDEDVRAVYGAGQRVFAENRAQELASRREADLPDDIEWHFVGPLQSRKAASVGEHAVLLQSMDRPKLARIWRDHCRDTPVLVQFNMAGEPQKSGFPPDDAGRVLDDLLALGLDVRGVMAIPPNATDPEMARPWFTQLRGIFDSYRMDVPAIDTCSMGMSNDLEVAIEEGATMVRIGRAIFDGTADT